VFATSVLASSTGFAVSAFSAGFSVTPSYHVDGLVHSGIAEQAVRRPTAAANENTRKTGRYMGLEAPFE
jgi:hypothetical protein